MSTLPSIEHIGDAGRQNAYADDREQNQKEVIPAQGVKRYESHTKSIRIASVVGLFTAYGAASGRSGASEGNGCGA